MIDQDQRELRRAAAKDFIEALDQLQERLQSTDNQPTQPVRSPAPKPVEPEISPMPFDLNAFEQAVADIEEYIQQKQTGEG
jgi:anthranilate/para-aminobenzoate synthase component I